MALSSRPIPLLDAVARPRPLCPVCGSATYSAAGIHPQCSVALYDQMHRERIGKRVSEPAPKPIAPVIKAWHRLCPRCGEQTHFRKPECACGHAFKEARPESEPE
jgi:hypothetical protein